MDRKDTVGTKCKPFPQAFTDEAQNVLFKDPVRTAQ